MEYKSASQFSAQDIPAMMEMLRQMGVSANGPPDHFVKDKLMSVYAYWNGTAFPVITGFKNADDWDDQKAKYSSVLVAGLRAGDTLEAQGQHYKRQMDLWEKTLLDLARKKNGKNGPISQEHIAQATERLGFPTPVAFQHHWYCNVHNLLKLGVIKDNDDFGFLIMGDPRNAALPLSQAERIFGDTLDIPGTFTMCDHDPSITTNTGASTLPEGCETCAMPSKEFLEKKGYEYDEKEKKVKKKKGQNNKKKKKNKHLYLNAKTGTFQEIDPKIVGKDNKIDKEELLKMRKKHHEHKDAEK